jgi:hypothetical protein
LAAEASDDEADIPAPLPVLLQPDRAAVPATNPVMAAEIINALAVRVIVIVSLSY